MAVAVGRNLEGVGSITDALVENGYFMGPNPFSAADRNALHGLFQSVLGVYDLPELERRTRKFDASYEAGWAGYHYTGPDPAMGHPGKHSFTVRSRTRLSGLWHRIQESDDPYDRPLARLYGKSFELMDLARPVMLGVLARLDAELPGRSILAKHAQPAYGNPSKHIVSDDVRIVIYEASEPGAELSEPHLDRSSLTMLASPGGTFVDHNGSRVILDNTASPDEIVYYPGQRLMHPYVCPGVGFVATRHGAVSTTQPGPRAVITYQTHPLGAWPMGSGFGPEDDYAAATRQIEHDRLKGPRRTDDSAHWPSRYDWCI
ncbi:MAG TPA: hypothetical protein VLH84_02805 [Patescibacteria group bacterium]|nr:hypothetical protein [Patescibacteria group bacterium]